MNWWHYLLLVNFYLVLFFGFYTLLLRRETFFQLNRIYLVAASLLSFLIPLIQADWVKDLFITKQVQYTMYSSTVLTVYNLKPTESALTMGELINGLYIAVTLFLVLRLLWQLIILKKAIEEPSPSAAYSFFKKISLGEAQAESKIIQEHERVHARQWHSVDVLIIETVMIINWFNPVVYLYRFAIQYIHEFIADRQVIQAGTDKADYALLLLSQTFDVPTHRLVTPFYNHSLLKQRIMMLQKNRSQRIALAKYGLSVPLFILMLVFSSATINNSKAVKTINKKTEKVLSATAADAFTVITDHAEIKNKYIAQPVIDTVPKDDKVFSSVEKLPEFPGGMQAFYQFLAKTVRYPATDREKKIEGKAIVQFIVEKDGKLSNLKAVRGPSETINAEAVRALSLSPNWKPAYQNGKVVRVAFTVPISFTLEKPTAQSTTDPNPDNKVFSVVEKQPSFPGGVEGFMQYLAKNVKYPAEMREKKVQGKVIVQFIVERDGSLTDVRAIRGPGYGSSEEAVRVISESPKWQPGLQNGKPVRLAYTVPISFALNN